MRALLHRVIAQRKGRIWVGIFLLATFWVWQRYAVVQTGNRIQHLRSSVTDLAETRDALLAETTTLSSRNRIEALASAHLGLRPMSDKQHRHLPADRELSGSDVSRPIAGTVNGEAASQ